ncbi:hypothetical protein [Bradyrhizobium sp. CCGB20]|uniref:hypothetical protein n=1 Tax=Bradyrhizobium sp. CCGB20 TaxID=2949633 RepID=UPI0020B29D99|nr:hypothetical protein [Bradyrhizobium sp. CCGB20]MCP3399921.1 hypothetical protein [Bradyrhizobium sp. CCGB20]
MPLLTIKEAAARLSVSPQWLKYWLVDNPEDAAGTPFYLRMGNRLKFEENDVERILTHLRELESARLGPSIKAKAKLAGLMSRVGGYDHLLEVREAADRRKREAKSKHGPRRRVTLPDWPK